MSEASQYCQSQSIPLCLNRCSRRAVSQARYVTHIIYIVSLIYFFLRFERVSTAHRGTT